MPVSAAAAQDAVRFPLRQILRRIEGLEGRVEFSLTIKPRPDDGQITPSFEQRGRAGYCADFGGRMLFVAVDRPLEIGQGILTGRALVSRGETVTLWLSYAEDAPAVYPQRHMPIGPGGLGAAGTAAHGENKSLEVPLR